MLLFVNGILSIVNAPKYINDEFFDVSECNLLSIYLFVDIDDS